jgi:hypothetical protein
MPKILDVVVRRVAAYEMWGSCNLPYDDKAPESREPTADNPKIQALVAISLLIMPESLTAVKPEHRVSASATDPASEDMPSRRKGNTPRGNYHHGI